MSHYASQHQSNNKFSLSIVPLNEISINLQSYKIQNKVGDIAMKKKANRYSPELIPIPNPRVVFVLKLKNRTIPSKFILDCFCVAINDKYKEAY